jgi:hypothetical protein
VRADSQIKTVFSTLYESLDIVQKASDSFAENVEWDDTAEGALTVGRASVVNKLLSRQASMKPGGAVVIERIADGMTASGYTWYYKADGVEGKDLRGTTFVSLNKEGKVDYVQEVAEPLFKPGAAIVPLLKAVTAKAVKDFVPEASQTFVRRIPSSASDLVRYLWFEAQGQDTDEFLHLVSDDILYEDFNYNAPFVGKAEVRAFLKEFDFPGIKFVPERISDGKQSCCFTWRVELAGVEQATKGISFYSLDNEGKLGYLRDIPEPAIKPPPLRSLAALVRPRLGKFKASV